MAVKLKKVILREVHDQLGDAEYQDADFREEGAMDEADIDIKRVQKGPHAGHSGQTSSHIGSDAEFFGRTKKSGVVNTDPAQGKKPEERDEGLMRVPVLREVFSMSRREPS